MKFNHLKEYMKSKASQKAAIYFVQKNVSIDLLISQIQSPIDVLPNNNTRRAHFPIIWGSEICVLCYKLGGDLLYQFIHTKRQSSNLKEIALSLKPLLLSYLKLNYIDPLSE